MKKGILLTILFVLLFQSVTVFAETTDKEEKDPGVDYWLRDYTPTATPMPYKPVDEILEDLKDYELQSTPTPTPEVIQEEVKENTISNVSLKDIIRKPIIIYIMFGILGVVTVLMFVFTSKLFKSYNRPPYVLLIVFILLYLIIAAYVGITLSLWLSNIDVISSYLG